MSQRIPHDRSGPRVTKGWLGVVHMAGNPESTTKDHRKGTTVTRNRSPLLTNGIAAGQKGWRTPPKAPQEQRGRHRACLSVHCNGNFGAAGVGHDVYLRFGGARVAPQSPRLGPK